jgi:Nif-specific regulatory protein
VPVLHNGEVWGAIVVDSILRRKEFTEQNLKFMRFFSNLLSLALDRLLREESLHKENIFLKNQLRNSTTIPDIIGESPAMKSAAALIHKVAATEASVLILGESGTGKDIIASSIHKLSARKDAPFLAQFCGSIADSLLESELFGYKKGAFTGANTDKKGLFEAANKGTFFLDEIGDISMTIQAKLLRVLQNKELIRVGDNEPLKVDVRIIAATNKDLRVLTKEGKFREDLFYRLNVFPITIPPLRERAGDVKLLTNYFIRKHSNKDLGITREALNLLENYSWPGNVRQLENTIQRALILCDDNMIQTSHIILEQEEEISNFSGTLLEFEKLILFKRLQKYNGNRTATAKSLDVSVRWIQLKLKEAASEGHSELKNL